MRGNQDIPWSRRKQECSQAYAVINVQSLLCHKFTTYILFEGELASLPGGTLRALVERLGAGVST